MPELGPPLTAVLRAALAAPAPATEAARSFLAGFDPARALDPRTYAAVPAAATRLGAAVGGDDPRARRIAGVVKQTWSRNQVRLATVGSTLDALRRVGVVPCVLPGAVTAMAALGDPGARVLERVDVLIRPEHLPRVAAALLATGASVRQDHAPLLEGRAAWQPLVYAELADGAIVVRWDQPPLGVEDVAPVLDDARPAHLGALLVSAAAPDPALVLALAQLTDDDPGPVGWTNAFLEVARLQRLLGTDPARIEAAARRAHTVGRHSEWAALLELVARISEDPTDADAAARFAAVRVPPAPTRPLAAGAPRRRPSTPRRAVGVLRQFHAYARRRDEPITVRGLVRYLRARWHVGPHRALWRELGSRLVRARPPHDQPGSGGSAAATAASSAATE